MNLARTIVISLLVVLAPQAAFLSYAQEKPSLNCENGDFDCLVYQHSRSIAVLCKAEDYDCRIREYSKLIESNPVDGTAYFGRAQNYWAKEQELAIKDFNRAIELNPSHFQAYILLGVLYCSVGNECMRAIVEFDRAIAVAKQDANESRKIHRQANAHGHRGFAYLLVGELVSALGEYSIEVELEPKRDGGYFGRGTVLAAMGETERAIAEYDKAIELNPDYWLSYRHRGQLYKLLGRESEGEADLKRSEELKNAEEKRNSPQN